MAEVSNVTFLIVSVTLTCLAGLFVFGRLIANWLKKGSKNTARAHEFILLLSLAALGAAVAGYNHFILTLTDPTTSLVYLMKLSHALTWLGAFMLWGCKVPVLLLYISLFGIHRWLKITSYALIIISGTIFVILTSFVTAKCRGPIDDTLLPRCTMATTRAGFTLGLVSVLTDLVIFTMPLPIILRLNLPLQKRIGVALVFASGLAGITASIISTHYKYQAMRWSTTSGTNAMICTIVECAVALIVACVPSLYGLWNQSIVESGIYSRFSWRLSQVFSSSRSARSQSRASGGSSSSINSKESYSSESVKKSVSIHVVDEESLAQPTQGR